MPIQPYGPSQTPLGAYVTLRDTPTLVGDHLSPMGAQMGIQPPPPQSPLSPADALPHCLPIPMASGLSLSPHQSPAYTLVWTRQNHGTLPAGAVDFNGILTLRNVRPEDAGVYVCTGSNMLDMDEGTATLYVQGKPAGVRRHWGGGHTQCPDTRVMGSLGTQLLG